MSRRKANVRPDLVGELFVDGDENIYRLRSCGAEPLAYMEKIGENGIGYEKPISYFANFVQLKPIRPIEKPKKPLLKKPRADSGGTHKKRATVQGILDAGEKIKEGK